MPPVDLDRFINSHLGMRALLRARVRVYAAVPIGDREIWLGRLLTLLLELYVVEMQETGAYLWQWRNVSILIIYPCVLTV